MFMSVFLVLSSSLFDTSCTDALPMRKIHVCKSTKREQGHSINLVHDASETPLSGACSCIIKTDSDVTMETEPGNKCSTMDCPEVQNTCTIHCESSWNPKPKSQPFLRNGTNININVTNINGTIMNLKETNGSLGVHCHQTERVTRADNKDGVHQGRSFVSSTGVDVSTSVSRPTTVGGNTEKAQKDATIDICSSNTTRGPKVNIVHGHDDLEKETCTCSLRSSDCLTIKHSSNSVQCRGCGNQDNGSNCTMRCETSSDCTRNVTITVNALMEKGEILIITGHTGDNSAEGSAGLEVSCNPRPPTNIDEGEPSNFPTTTVAAAVSSAAILILLVAALVAVILFERKKRMKRNPVYMTLEAGSGRGTIQAASPPRPEDAPEQRLNGQTATGSNPSSGHSSHGMASASVHHPTEDGAEGQSHQGEDIRSGPIDVIPKQGTVDEGMYDSAGTPSPDPGIGGGGMYGKLTRDPKEEGVYDHAHGGTAGKVQQVTGIYGRLGQQVDDDVYDHARRSEVTASVTDGSTYGRLNDVAEDDVYNHTKTTKSKVEAFDNEDFSRIKQDEEVLGKC